MLKTVSLNEKVYEHLKELIYDNAFTTTEPIFETQLAEQLGVSRTPVREAIHLLKSEGLLEAVSGGGVRAFQITTQDLHDAFDIRIAHEVLAVKMATLRMGQVDKDNLELIFERTEKYLDQGLMGEVLKENETFHRFIATTSKSRLVEQILDRIYDYVKLNRWQTMVRQQSDVFERVQLSHSEHLLIAEAMCAGKATKAEKLMQTHLMNNKSYLQKNLPFIE